MSAGRGPRRCAVSAPDPAADTRISIVAAAAAAAGCSQCTEWVHKPSSPWRCCWWGYRRGWGRNWGCCRHWFCRCGCRLQWGRHRGCCRRWDHCLLWGCCLRWGCCFGFRRHWGCCLHWGRWSGRWSCCWHGGCWMGWWRCCCGGCMAQGPTRRQATRCAAAPAAAEQEGQRVSSGRGGCSRSGSRADSRCC